MTAILETDADGLWALIVHKSLKIVDAHYQQEQAEQKCDHKQYIPNILAKIGANSS